MEYMLTIYTEPYEAPAPGTPEFDRMMAGWMEYNQRLIDGGHWVSAASLAPATTATTVRKSFGTAPSVTDGPFAETKEHLGGYYVVRAADLDEALELAKAVPVPVGSVEVRPVALRPDAT